MRKKRFVLSPIYIASQCVQLVAKGNAAFRKGDFKLAAEHYEVAYQIEPELPHYQLNLAQAYLKLNKWVFSSIFRSRQYQPAFIPS